MMGKDQEHESHPTPTGDLARRAAAKEDVFNRLYARIAPSLLAWAEIRLHARLKRLVDPEDIVQEVWCRAMDRYRTSGGPDPDKFRPWIFGIAHFVVMEALRRTRPQIAGVARSETPATDLEEVPASVTSLSRQLKTEDSFRVFLEHVSTFDDEDRHLLLYRGLEGQTHKEVAHRMGVDQAVARKRWERLRERLRAMKLPEHLLEMD